MTEASGKCLFERMKKPFLSSDSLAQLVEQIRNDPSEVEARLVLADVLMEQGNPQGQLMLRTASLEPMTVGTEPCRELQSQINETKASHSKWQRNTMAFEDENCM
jgi:uncharacterized protein (TIGR02996 family)